jgi:hypothetical protein
MRLAAQFQHWPPALSIKILSRWNYIPAGVPPPVRFFTSPCKKLILCAALKPLLFLVKPANFLVVTRFETLSLPISCTKTISFSGSCSWAASSQTFIDCSRFSPCRTLVCLTSLRTNDLPMPPKLNQKRALFVLTKIDEILAWERRKKAERETRFVELER